MQLDREMIRAALLKKGFREGRSDHDYYYLYVEEKKTGIFTKLSRGTRHKTYGEHLIGEVKKQLGLSKPDFLEFVKCPLTEVEYVQRLKDNQKIRI